MLGICFKSLDKLKQTYLSPGMSRIFAKLVKSKSMSWWKRRSKCSNQCSANKQYYSRQSVLSILLLFPGLTSPQHWQIFCCNVFTEWCRFVNHLTSDLTKQGTIASGVHLRPFNHYLFQCSSKCWMRLDCCVLSLSVISESDKPNQFWITRHPSNFEIRHGI